LGRSRGDYARGKNVDLGGAWEDLKGGRTFQKQHERRGGFIKTDQSLTGLAKKNRDGRGESDTSSQQIGKEGGRRFGGGQGTRDISERH